MSTNVEHATAASVIFIAAASYYNAVIQRAIIAAKSMTSSLN